MPDFLAIWYLLKCVQAPAEEGTESWGPLREIKDFSITKIEFLWRALKFKRGHGPPFLPPMCTSTHVLSPMSAMYHNLAGSCIRKVTLI